MTSAERIQTIKAMPVTPDRYFAVYCHEVVGHIEDQGYYGGITRHACKQFRDGIRRFFSIQTEEHETPRGMKITIKTPNQ